MHAQSVWHTWRRIMREVPLQQALFEPGESALSDDALRRFGLQGDEILAARAYSEQADRAKWFVLNYRFRLANSFLNALETGAPLVLRALLNKGADVNQLGCEFLDQHAWKDFGPYVYTYCAQALEFLKNHPVSAAPQGMQDLIDLEATVVHLMRDMSQLPPYPAEEVHRGMLRRSPYARTYSSRHRLSAVLRDKKILGRTDLDRLPEGQREHIVVYLPNPEQFHKYGLLPQRALEILTALETPCSSEELSQCLAKRGFPAHMEVDSLCLTQLKVQQAIFGEGA